MARIDWHTLQITTTAVRLATPLVQKTGQEILDGARHLAPEGSHMSGSGRPKAGPRLQSSFYSTTGHALQPRVSQIVMRIGNRADYAATVHQGSKPHTIMSKQGKKLKFRWDRGDFLVAARAGRRRGNRRTGGFHYFLKVRHPGNKRPVRYLTTPLAMFGRLNGFRVSVSGVNRSRLP